MSEHWLEHAHGRIVAGDDELDVLADYGWLRLTDAERAAVGVAIQLCEDITYGGPNDAEAAATLRNLLERLK